MVSRGRLWDVAGMPGFVVEGPEGWLSYGTYRIEGGECELAMLDSPFARRGGGSAVTEAIVTAARRAGCRRVWLITTNDNVEALAFYQRRGFRLAGLHRDAVTEARKALKPEIPEVARNGIPIRDELELELEL
jgi:ribosomal protein S18 acetylase RimI-like enzyme